VNIKKEEEEKKDEYKDLKRKEENPK